MTFLKAEITIFEQSKTIVEAAPIPKALNTFVETEKEAPKTVEQIQTVALNTETPDSSKTTTDTTVGIRMTMQKKREIKAYFIQKGTTLSQGILDAYNLLKELDVEGIISYKDGQLIRNK